jgi:hypothetical protein
MPPFTTRRRALSGAAAFVSIVTFAPEGARAGVLTPKAQVKYQYQPQGAGQCSLCASFAPGPDAGGPGTCKIVEGPISPTGWCLLFSPRPRSEKESGPSERSSPKIAGG